MPMQHATPHRDVLVNPCNTIAFWWTVWHNLNWCHRCTPRRLTWPPHTHPAFLTMPPSSQSQASISFPAQHGTHHNAPYQASYLSASCTLRSPFPPSLPSPDGLTHLGHTTLAHHRPALHPQFPVHTRFAMRPLLLAVSSTLPRPTSSPPGSPPGTRTLPRLSRAPPRWYPYTPLLLRQPIPTSPAFLPFSACLPARVSCA